MRALVLTDFWHLDVEERPDPEPNVGEVLLRVVATGICGSDLHGFTGHNGRRAPGQIMGHESVGRIVALGPHTEDFVLEVGSLATFNPVVLPEAELAEFEGREQHAPGKRVIGVAPELVSGFAQLITVPARNVVVLPDSMPESYGALIEPIAVALHAVRRAGVRATRSVLVIGGGPIGQSVILAARHEGAERVLISEPDPARRELCQLLGAEAVTSDPDLAVAVRTTLGGAVDVTIDAVGLSGTLDSALAATALGGTVCLVGMGSQQVSLTAFRISSDERSIVGSFAYSSTDFRDAAAWVATAPPSLAHLISREIDLDEAADAFTEMASGRTAPGKTLVRL